MTRRANLFERVRDANPVPGVVEPDWGSVRERVAGEQDGELGGPAGTPAVAGGRWRVSSRLGGVLAGLALCAAGAIIAVLALAPSGGSSDFLARAAAALTPAGGTVLYERWEKTIAPEAGNPERRQAITFGPEQLWIEGGHPHRYRTILLPRSGPSEGSSVGAGLASAGVGLASTYGVTLGWSGFGPRPGGIPVLTRVQRATSGGPLELGGTVEAATGRTNPGSLPPTLTFLPPNELLRARLRVTLGPSLPGPHDQIIEDGADPVSALRAAISEGRARMAGTRQLDGRTVQRIDIHLPQQLPADAPPLPPGHPVIHSEAYAYVEPETFHPVEIVYGGQTDRFLTYEYLPATAANVALTDIQVQHPRARVLNTLQAPRGARAGKPH
ncbi:MAG TPA: hypothetical protein VK778_15785 [Solirubrobacteraceae bacterium]|jgi:hypothetical protein|nr:hypothetical protein [Solirubrobacteraceae bacterium]